jgi:hypothetical protein
MKSPSGLQWTRDSWCRDLPDRVEAARRVLDKCDAIGDMGTLTHLVVLLIAVSLAPAVSFAQRSDQVGKIQFANSCSSAVQEKLLRGIAMLHSFYYSATQKAFQEVAAEDDSCAIAA